MKQKCVSIRVLRLLINSLTQTMSEDDLRKGQPLKGSQIRSFISQLRTLSYTLTGFNYSVGIGYIFHPR